MLAVSPVRSQKDDPQTSTYALLARILSLACASDWLYFEMSLSCVKYVNGVFLKQTSPVVMTDLVVGLNCLEILLARVEASGVLKKHFQPSYIEFLVLF